MADQSKQETPKRKFLGMRRYRPSPVQPSIPADSKEDDNKENVPKNNIELTPIKTGSRLGLCLTHVKKRRSSSSAPSSVAPEKTPRTERINDQEKTIDNEPTTEEVEEITNSPSSPSSVTPEKTPDSDGSDDIIFDLVGIDLD